MDLDLSSHKIKYDLLELIFIIHRHCVPIIINNFLKYFFLQVKPLFVKKIQILEKSLGKIANALPSMTLLCIYMCSVLAPIEVI